MRDLTAFRRPMVNTTSEVVFLGDDPVRAVRTALLAIEASFPRPIPSQKRLLPLQRARNVFAVDDLPSGVDAQRLVSDLCALVTAPTAAERTALASAVCSTLGRKAAYRCGVVEGYRTMSKRVLYRLWSEGEILLPATFKLHGAIARSQVLEMAPEIMRFCLEFSSTPDEGSLATRMSLHVPRWLVCTGWHVPEAIELEDALEFGRFLTAASKGTIGFLDGGLLPGVSFFLRECLRRWPNRVGNCSTRIGRSLSA